jgi:nucleotide-binding universal stress UspA family protein
MEARHDPAARPRGIVVGYDGSAPSAHAVDWAAAEAARRGVPLTVASAVDFTGLVGGPGSGTPWLSRRAEDGLAETARRGAARARRHAPGADVREAVRTEGAAGMLVELSWTAELVVVGTRGHGEVAGAVLGSVAFAVTAHARCPVAVIAGTDVALPGPGRAVLAGVDGSAEAAAALAYAADLAAGVGAPLTVVTAWRFTAADAFLSAAGGDVDLTDETHELAGRVNRTAAGTVRRLHPGLVVRSELVVGVPGHVLAERGRRHALTVVGSRGHGGFRSLLLGSVSHAVIHQATTPVIVVRPRAGVVPPETTRRPAGGDDRHASAPHR